MADYLLTNAVRRTADWVTRFTDIMEREYGRRPDPEAVAAFLRVHPDWLGSAFTAIERSGGLEAYLLGLGVDGALRGRLESRLLR